MPEIFVKATVGESTVILCRTNKLERKKEEPVTWNNEITELEQYFEGIDILPHEIQLDTGRKIINCRKYIQTHLDTLRYNNGNMYFLPFLEDLQLLKGRNVILFPDLNGLNKWKERIKEFSSTSSVLVSEILDKKATEKERKQGSVRSHQPSSRHHADQCRYQSSQPSFPQPNRERTCTCFPLCKCQP